MLYRLNAGMLPRLHIFGRTNEQPPWRHGGRRAPEHHHLILIVSGECRCEIEGRGYDAAAGDLIFISAGWFYRLETHSHCEYYFACFTMDCVQADEETLRVYAREHPAENAGDFFLPPLAERYLWLREYSRPGEEMRRALIKLMVRCQQLYAAKKLSGRLMMESLLHEMLLVAGQTVFDECREEMQSLSLSRITQYIAENYAGRITLESLSENFRLSGEHICARFREEMNCTPSEYINEIKLTHAAELLLNSAMNVTEIAEYLGYSSVYYFSRLFKRRYLMSPTQYARSARQ